MLSYHFEDVPEIPNTEKYSDWLLAIADSEGYELGELAYIFCSDNYLLKLNQDYLKHDTLTDIITFDYVSGNLISGDVYISLERVADNAKEFGVSEPEELLRVMAHGLLHLCGYKDKTIEDQTLMTKKENEKIKMFHVEQ
ncbi:rRNA maturation RNase YbeY [Flavobacteriaceae bacterium LSUCC0859]|jgi:rRNA maturation RNase YbeY|nr:rRNA maturation RNase YbeY [Flavobacteriaceae bacterium LSUCC0859]